MNSVLKRVDLRLIALTILGAYAATVTIVSKIFETPFILSGFIVISILLFLIGGIVLIFGVESKDQEPADDEIVFGRVISPGRWGKRLFGLRASKFRHTLVTGMTGVGKSTLIRRYIEQVIKIDAGYGYFDFKGEQEDHEELLRINRAEGKPDPVIFDMSDPKRCAACNFLTFTESVSETVEMLTDLLIEKDSPSYFKNEAARFLKYSLNLLDAAGEWRTFIRIENLYQDSRYRSELLRRAKGAEEDLSSCINYFEQEFNLLKPQARSERLSGLISSLSKFTEGEFRRIFNAEGKNDLGLAEMFEGKRSAIIRVPGEVYGDFGVTIVTAFLRLLPIQMGRRRLQRDRKPYFLFLDEACSYLNEDLVDLGKKCGSANVKLFVTRMCDADFQKVDPALLGQFLSLFTAYICMQTHDPDTRETMARLAMTEENVKLTRKVGSLGDTGEGSERDVHQFRYHPTEFGRLNPGEAIVISPSLNVFEKIQILQAGVAA